MKKMFRKTPLKAVLLLITVAALLFSGVQTTRAALTVQSAYYQAQANMKDIGIAIMENGVVVSDGRLMKSVPKAVGSDVADSEFHFGVRYQENLAIQNIGEIDQYSRVIVTKYWAELDKDGNVVRKLSDLDPSLIEISFCSDGWNKVDMGESGERTMLYYTDNGGILPVGAISKPFATDLKVNGSLQLVKTQTTEKDGVVVYTYLYDGKAFVVEAEAQGVQTHNALDSIVSVWGADAAAIVFGLPLDDDDDGPVIDPEKPVEPEEPEEPTEEYVTITYKADEGGSVNRTIENVLTTGTAQGSTATANTDYHFVNWTDASGNEVSTDATFVPAKVKEETYTANFAKDGDITINYKATEGGSVSRSSESLAPTTGTAQGSTATANEGYHFVNWTDASGNEVSTDATFVPAKVDGRNVTATYTANFEEEFVVIFYRAEGDGGSVSPSMQNVQAVTGTPRGATAIPAPGYSFVCWKDASGEEVSYDQTFVPDKVNGMNVSTTYTACFEEEFVVIFYMANGEGGSVSPNMQNVRAVTGTAGGATATPANGYRFLYWTDASGNVVSYEPTFVPDRDEENGVYEPTTYLAYFEANGQSTGGASSSFD